MWYEGLTNQAVGEADAEHAVHCWQCDCLLDADNAQTTDWDRIGQVYLCADWAACQARRDNSLPCLPSEVDW